MVTFIVGQKKQQKIINQLFAETYSKKVCNGGFYSNNYWRFTFADGRLEFGHNGSIDFYYDRCPHFLNCDDMDNFVELLEQLHTILRKGKK